MQLHCEMTVRNPVYCLKNRKAGLKRVHAAYCWYIPNDAAAANDLLLKAEAVAESYVVSGFIHFEKAQLVQIRSAITQSPAAPAPAIP
jgi:hypothetical protein